MRDEILTLFGWVIIESSLGNLVHNGYAPLFGNYGQLAPITGHILQTKVFLFDTVLYCLFIMISGLNTVKGLQLCVSLKGKVTLIYFLTGRVQIVCFNCFGNVSVLLQN